MRKDCDICIPVTLILPPSVFALLCCPALPSCTDSPYIQCISKESQTSVRFTPDAPAQVVSIHYSSIY